MNKNNAGFTLLEMAIVLVIIGLAIGGIYVGTSMINTAKVQNVAKDYTAYLAAINAFEEKYGGLPGDLNNAEDIWAAATNGDSDLHIELDSGAGASANQEAFEFWLQLVEAELIVGEYTGISGPDGYADSIGDENCPEGPMEASYWGVRWEGNLTSGVIYPEHFRIYVGNHFTFGGLDSDGWPEQALMRVGDVYALDTKFDDGKPALGSVMSTEWDDCTDAINRNDTTADYLLTDETVKCNLRLFFEDAR